MDGTTDDLSGLLVGGRMSSHIGQHEVGGGQSTNNTTSTCMMCAMMMMDHIELTSSRLQCDVVCDGQRLN